MTNDQKLDFLIEQMMELKEDVQVLKEDVQVLKEAVQVLDNKVEILETNLGNLHLHIENVTDVNIVRVAEGHGDLWRRLMDVVKISEWNELRDIRLNVLEGDVRDIKQHLKMCVVS